MSTSPPHHRLLLLPEGGDPQSSDRALLDAVGGSGEPISLAAIPDGLPPGGGWLTVPARVAQEVVEPALSALSRSPDPWALLVEVDGQGEGDSDVRFLSCSPGFGEPVESVVRRLDGIGLESGYLSHRQLLLDLSRVRHDVNNALTSALAEAQFMRMDAPEGTELAEGLGLVEKQLQKIRDLIAELSVLRVADR